MKAIYALVLVIGAVGGAVFAQAVEPSSGIRITGRVVDGWSRPIEKISVTAAERGLNTRTEAVRTGDDGAFAISVSHPAVYELRFEALGFRRLVKTVAAASKADMNAGVMVMEVAPIEEPIDIPTILSVLPTSLDVAEPFRAGSDSEVIGVCESLRRIKRLNGSTVSIRGEFHSHSVMAVGCWTKKGRADHAKICPRQLESGGLRSGWTPVASRTLMS